jgi:hypothetical protein
MLNLVEDARADHISNFLGVFGSNEISRFDLGSAMEFLHRDAVAAEYIWRRT